MFLENVESIMFGNRKTKLNKKITYYRKEKKKLSQSSKCTHNMATFYNYII